MEPGRAASAPAAVHAAALRLAGALPPGTALDVPCGKGDLALVLSASGWRVTGGDRSPSSAQARGVDAVTVDLERPLPWPDSSFDLVLCVEGIEHVEAQAALLREASRVLRPGGALVVTTPNVLGRPSRTSLARRGYARFFRPHPAGFPTPYEHEHRHPIDVVRLEFLLKEARLVPEAWDGDAGPDGSPSWRGRFLRRCAARSIRKHNARADLLLLPAVFFSRVVAVRARKPRS